MLEASRIMQKLMILRTVRPRARALKSANASSSSISQMELKSLGKMPGPKGLPVLGTLLDHVFNGGLSNSHDVYLKWAQKYGAIFRDKIVGVPNAIVVSDPEIIKKLNQIEGKQPYRNIEIVFREFFQARADLGFRIGFLGQLNGEEWAELRQTLHNKFLRPMEVKNYYGGFNEVTLRAINIIQNTKDSKNHIIDITDLLGRWSLDSISTFLFGEHSGLLNDPPDQSAERMYQNLTNLLAYSLEFSRLPWKKYFFKSKVKHIKEATNDIYEEGIRQTEKCARKINDAITHGKPLDGYLDKSLLAHLLQKDDLSLNDCAVIATDNYIPGLDTTQSTAAWLLYNLAIYPEVQNRLYQEIMQNMPEDGIVSYEAVQGMPYLRGCLKESARLYPVSAAVIRIKDKDIELGGYLIPKKTIIVISNYNMARSEELFPDPLAFKPERWMRNNIGIKPETAEPVPFSLLPFGFGPRMCLDGLSYVCSDLVILSETENGLTETLERLSNYAKKWKLKICPKKTKIIVFNKAEEVINVKPGIDDILILSEDTFAINGLIKRQDDDIIERVKSRSSPKDSSHVILQGKRVAEAEIQVFCSQLLKRYKLEYHGKPLKGVIKFILAPEHPLHFSFQDR